jgi:hypothetical protein
MKLFALCTLLFASVAAASAGQQTQPQGANRSSSPFAVAGREVYRPTVTFISPKARQIRQLRVLALKLQEADGGALSAEHYAMLQAKLDAIHTAN